MRVIIGILVVILALGVGAFLGMEYMENQKKEAAGNIFVEAISTNNPDLCVDIEGITCVSVDNQLNCQRVDRASCFHELALKLEKDSLCKRAESRRDKCYYEVALSQSNAELCQESGRYEIECYGDIAKETLDASVCDYMSTSSKQGCYYQLAVMTLNYDLCDDTGVLAATCAQDITNRS